MSSTAVDFTVLTTVERSRLAECEEVIAHGVTVFVRVGRALAEIRDGKLYRETHATFEAYCQERWQISRPRAYEIMDQARVSTELHTAAGLSDASDISTRDARHLKLHIEDAKNEIRERVEAGAEPEAAVQATVERHRQERREERRAKERQEPGPPPEVEPSHDEGGFDKEKEIIALIEESARLADELASHRSTDAGREIERLHTLVQGQSSRIATLTTQYKEAAEMAQKRGKVLREIRALLGVESDRDIVPQLRELVA